jgi:WD40 repeat protein
MCDSIDFSQFKITKIIRGYSEEPLVWNIRVYNNNNIDVFDKNGAIQDVDESKFLEFIIKGKNMNTFHQLLKEEINTRVMPYWNFKRIYYFFPALNAHFYILDKQYNVIVAENLRDIKITPIHHPEETIKVLEGHKRFIVSINRNIEGTLIVSSSLDGTIKIWDVETGKCIKTLNQHNKWSYSVAFSPDNTKVISASSDKTVKIWDLNSGKCIKRLRGHRGQIWQVEYSPNGKYIVSGTERGIVKVWNADTGKAIRTLRRRDWETDDDFSGYNDRDILQVFFNTEGDSVIAGFIDGTTIIWEADNTIDSKTSNKEKNNKNNSNNNSNNKHKKDKKEIAKEEKEKKEKEELLQQEDEYDEEQIRLNFENFKKELKLAFKECSFHQFLENKKGKN